MHMHTPNILELPHHTQITEAIQMAKEWGEGVVDVPAGKFYIGEKTRTHAHAHTHRHTRARTRTRT